MMWPAARDFCVAQDIFSQEYWRISRKNDAAHRKKARCPGALGVFRYTLGTDFVLFGIFQKNRCISTNFASIYYADCRLSLLSAQKGKCSVSGELFLNPDNIVCYMLLFESIERRKPDSVAVRQYKVFKLAAGKTAKSSPPSRRRCPSDCAMPG